MPIKQFQLMETVKREHIQVLSYVNYFVQAIEKAALNMEHALQSFQSVMKDAGLAAEFDSLLNHLQIQFSCVSSLVMALENLVDSSITMACNLELARRDSILKHSCSHLREHEVNMLRRTGFKSGDLFCPSTLNAIDKKYEKSPKRPKVAKPIFQSRRFSEGSQRKSSFRSSTMQSNRRPFQENKSSTFTPLATRGRGGRRK